MERIKNVLLIFSLIAIVTVALIGIFLVLDLASGPEAKEMLTKTLSVISILAAVSIIAVFIVGLANKK